MRSPTTTSDATPFSLPIVQGGGFDIRFDRAITIIARENGARQSTLREAITTLAGFSEHGSPQGMAAVGRIAAGAEYAGGLGR